MADRAELLEVALDSLPEGLALLGGEGQVMLWNRAAEAITGYASADLLSRQTPEQLEPLLLSCSRPGIKRLGRNRNRDVAPWSTFSTSWVTMSR